MEMNKPPHGKIKKFSSKSETNSLEDATNSNMNNQLLDGSDCEISEEIICDAMEENYSNTDDQDEENEDSDAPVESEKDNEGRKSTFPDRPRAQKLPEDYKPGASNEKRNSFSWKKKQTKRSKMATFRNCYRSLVLYRTWNDYPKSLKKFFDFKAVLNEKVADCFKWQQPLPAYDQLEGKRNSYGNNVLNLFRSNSFIEERCQFLRNTLTMYECMAQDQVSKGLIVQDEQAATIVEILSKPRKENADRIIETIGKLPEENCIIMADAFATFKQIFDENILEMPNNDKKALFREYLARILFKHTSKSEVDFEFPQWAEAVEKMQDLIFKKYFGIVNVGVIVERFASNAFFIPYEMATYAQMRFLLLKDDTITKTEGVFIENKNSDTSILDAINGLLTENGEVNLEEFSLRDDPVKFSNVFVKFAASQCSNNEILSYKKCVEIVEWNNLVYKLIGHNVPPSLLLNSIHAMFRDLPHANKVVLADFIYIIMRLMKENSFIPDNKFSNIVAEFAKFCQPQVFPKEEDEKKQAEAKLKQQVIIGNLARALEPIISIYINNFLNPYIGPICVKMTKIDLYRVPYVGRQPPGAALIKEIKKIHKRNKRNNRY